MIGYIEGKVMAGDGITVLLMVNGIGYEVSCSGAAYAMLMNAGEGGVYTYLQVKEDGISLFGFISPEEKNLFVKLISVFFTEFTHSQILAIIASCVISIF